MRIKFLVSYDGTEFGGWQLQAQPAVLPVQKNRTARRKPTVQGTIEDALSKVLKHPVRIHGSGRTDAGAHALGQVAHFDTPVDVSKYDLRSAVSRYLPPSIVVRNVWQAPDDFHSLFQCTRKTYTYVILNRPLPSALRRNHLYWLRRPLKLNHLNDCAKYIVGTHDFKSFQTRGTPVESTIRTIFEAHWQQPSKHILKFTITGSGFLKQMVRNLVGTMIDLNLRQEPQALMTDILTAQDRRVARAAAPAHGLYLYRVFYPAELDKKCRQL